jgi:hypothetical protein
MVGSTETVPVAVPLKQRHVGIGVEHIGSLAS